MARRLLLSLALVSVAPSFPSARNGGAGTAAAQAAVARESSQFDFLIGQWEVTVTPKPVGLAQRIHGAPRLAGTWKASRASGGNGVEDELRIVDRSGNPVSLTRATRTYDTTKKRWTQTVRDVNRQRTSTAEGTWSNGAMTMTGPGTDAEGKAILVRMRFHDISATSFKYQTDRSRDGGRSWEEGVVKMDARRVSPNAPR